MKGNGALVVQADARQLPLPDASVDLIVTSPPFWNLRDYGVPGQIGVEASRDAFLEQLWEVTAECMRVMKPTASLFVELGDSYATRYSSQRGAGRAGLNDDDSGRGRSGQNRTGSPEKSLNLTPERYAIGCIDRLGLILRAKIVIHRLNSLPESVRDRVRTSDQSQMFHLVKSPRYYSAVDELREPHARLWDARNGGSLKGGSEYTVDTSAPTGHQRQAAYPMPHPLGKLPGSVWPMTSEPLDLPGYFVMESGRLLDFLAPQRGSPRPRPNGHHPGLFDADVYLELVASGDGPAWRWLRATGVDRSPWPRDDTALQLRVAASHYAAFSSRLPELVIKGWSPPGVCLACGEGRWPVVDRHNRPLQAVYNGSLTKVPGDGREDWRTGVPQVTDATILGYACRCTPFADHPGTGESSGPDGRYAAAIEGGAYPNTMMGLGKPGLAARPKVGPWREYHLSGWRAPPTRPAVVLDPFSGVGTTIGVARQLGRTGIGIDLSHPYCRAAKWRVFDSGSFGKAVARTWADRQGSLL